MFKFIPEEFLKDDYSENISHYNFYNLLNNYETILDTNNFNLKHTWSKEILISLTSGLKTRLKNLNEIFNKENNTLEKDFLGKETDLQSSIEDFKDFNEDNSFFETHFNDLFSYFTDVENRNNLLLHCKPEDKDTPFLARSNVSIDDDYYVNLNTAARKSCRYSRFFNFKSILNSTKNYKPKKLYEKELKNYIFQQYINKTLFSVYEDSQTIFKSSLLENIARSHLVDEETFAQKLDTEHNFLNAMFLNWFKQRVVNTEYGYFDSLQEYFDFLDSDTNCKIFNYEKNDLTLTVYAYHGKQERINKLANLFSRYVRLEQYLILSNLLSFISYSQLTTSTNKTVHLNMYNENLIFCKKEHDCLRNNQLFFSNFHSSTSFSLNPNADSPTFHFLHEDEKFKRMKKTNHLNSDSTYNNYLVVKFNYHHIENDQHIYSRFDKSFLDLFGNKIIKIDDDVFCNMSSKEYSFKLPIDNDKGGENKEFFLNSNTSHVVTSDTFSNEQKTYLFNYLKENSKKRIKVIYYPGLDNKSKKKYPVIQGTTLKTLLTKKGFLVPVMLPFVHLNGNNEEQKSWNICLLNFNENSTSGKNFYNFAYHMNSDYFRLTSKDSVIFIMSLFKKLFSYNNLILTDPKEYERLKYSKFNSISQYNQNNAVLFYDAFKKTSISNQDKFLKAFNDAKGLINPTSKKGVLDIFAKVKLDESIKINYDKVKKRYDKINSKLKDLKKRKLNYKEHVVALEHDVERYLNVIEEKKQKLLNTQQSLEQQEQEIETFQIQYNSISELMNQKSQEYKKNYELNFNKKNYELNAFLKNISKNNINLSYILFSMKNEPRSLFLYYSHPDYLQVKNFNLERDYYSYYDSEYNHNYDDLITEMDVDKQYKFEGDNIYILQSLLQNNDYSIKKVCFTTIKPSLIKIDNKEKYVVGGPYRITVSTAKVRIGLLNFSSVMGVDNIDTPKNIKAHPHSNSYSLHDILSRDEATLLKPTNGCLGEASTMIYHAFNQNDLSRILLSTMIWVKSANSADVWGKTYKWFPEPNDVDFEFDALGQLPTSSEINSFIDSELKEIEVSENEEPSEEDIFRMETQELEQQEQEQIQETQNNNQQDIETFNTDDTYVRYRRT